MANVTTIMADCLLAEASIVDTFYNIVRCVEIVFAVVIFVLLAKLVVELGSGPVPMHPNLKVGFWSCYELKFGSNGILGD